MKKTLLFLLILSIISNGFSFDNKDLNNIDFNGYIQIRGTSNFDDNAGFALRRLKLWIKSRSCFSQHWSYKVQVTFSSFLQEKFFLQDVKLGYKTGQFLFDIGQFVPQYSLQRFQHDYELSVIERAKVINVLIPDGTLGVRDIGAQASYQPKNKLYETHLGVFNGYGIKNYRFNNQGYMLIHKSAINIPVSRNNIKFGYSLQYRYAQDLQLKFIYPDTVKFSGNDFRYNLFALYKSKNFEIQAEFLNADFNGQRAYGFYVLSTLNLKKNQFVLSFEEYNDLIKETIDKPYYRVAYNYLIKSYKIKLWFDNYFQINKKHIKKYFASIQLQLFFN